MFFSPQTVPVTLGDSGRLTVLQTFRCGMATIEPTAALARDRPATNQHRDAESKTLQNHFQNGAHRTPLQQSSSCQFVMFISRLWQPLCFAQIGGLAVATFITLLPVPVFYAIF